MQILLAAGDAAGARGWLWRVDRVEAAGRRAALVHLTRPGDRRETTMAAIRPAEPLARVAAVDSLRPVPLAEAVEAVRQAARRDRPAFGLTSVERLRGAVHDWQLAAALAFARGHGRVLLADAVGMGKTVSAAIAVAECLDEAPDRRCLVLVPAHLLGQWRHELRHRSGIAAALADAAGLRRIERTLPAGTPGWALPGCLVAPIDFVKQPHVAHALETLRWDLLVIDEAHSVCGDSERHTACAMLARRARRVLLLTATPSDGTGERRAALEALGAAGEPLVALRHEPPGTRAPMRERCLLVAPHPSLASLHRALARYTSRIASGAMRDTPAIALLAVLLTRRALSSPHALRLSLERRLALLGTDAGQAQLALCFTFGAEDDEGVLGAPSGLRATDERMELRRLIAAAALAARADRRLAALQRLIRRGAEPAVVFTCFRDTALLIAGRLEPTAGARVVHGRLPAAVIDAVIADFVDGSLPVLVATDVAAQGLNLHARCRWVIHYDLPWRPSTLRQRNGRVDRLGQQKPPRATLLLDREAIGTLERLQAQAARMREEDPATPRRWRTLAAAEAARVRRRRGELAHDLPALALPAAGADVVEISLGDAAGALIERTSLALDGGTGDAAWQAAVWARRRARALARRLEARRARRIARERAVAEAAREAVAPELHQDGLFDRREARRREADEDTRMRIRHEERDAIAAHEAAGGVASARVRVVASFRKGRRKAQQV